MSPGSETIQIEWIPEQSFALIAHLSMSDIAARGIPQPTDRMCSAVSLKLAAWLDCRRADQSIRFRYR
jgi:hypothetical protein